MNNYEALIRDKVEKDFPEKLFELEHFLLSLEQQHPRARKLGFQVASKIFGLYSAPRKNCGTKELCKLVKEVTSLYIKLKGFENNRNGFTHDQLKDFISDFRIQNIDTSLKHSCEKILIEYLNRPGDYCRQKLLEKEALLCIKALKAENKPVPVKVTNLVKLNGDGLQSVYSRFDVVLAKQLRWLSIPSKAHKQSRLMFDELDLFAVLIELEPKRIFQSVSNEKLKNLGQLVKNCRSSVLERELRIILTPQIKYRAVVEVLAFEYRQWLVTAVAAEIASRQLLSN